MGYKPSSVKLAMSARWAALLLFGAGFTLSCAAKSGDTSFVTTCQLPSDQSGTLSGHWGVTPVPVAFHSGDFSNAEMATISGAAQTWNSFFSATANLALINITGVAAGAKPASICSQTILSGNKFNSPVVIYKDAIWPYPNMPNAIALTTFCPTPSRPLASFYQAVIEVNYQNFFVAGHKVPDLQSILLHEFGHLAGLNHSCEVSGGTGMPVCANSNSEYSSAVMAPIFSFDGNGFGQVKQELTSNDEGRANCLGY